MNIASMTTPAMMAPLQNLLRWLLPTAAKPVVHQPTPACHRGGGALKASSPRPLRVVRFLEAGQTSAQVGRMVISGRMSDVCAELDRLAAREAALH
jgi:hypothetical protein